MITLGLDPSMTGFGWCVHNSNVVGTGRVVAKGRFTTSSKAIFVQRYIELRSSVEDVLNKYPQIEGVGVESPPFGELWSEGLYGLFVMVNEAIYKHRKDVVYFDPVTLKMLVKVEPDARYGMLDKADMVMAAKTDTGIKGTFNHNEADAYHIARFSARFWLFFKGDLLEEHLSDAEWRAFARIHTFKRGQRAGQVAKLGAVYKEGQRFFRFSQIPVE
jgi:Holliday junction resolvasome RuvABC endonuclease subunit